MRHEIDKAIIATVSLRRHDTSVGQSDNEPEKINFLAFYIRACIKTKRRALKVYGGLLDTVERTATQLMAEPEISGNTHFEKVLLDLCHMVLLSQGLNHVLFLIEWEEEKQERYHPGGLESETFRSAAYILPASIFLRIFGLTNRLLERHLDLNVDNEYFWSPLCAAAFTGQEDLTQRLLDKGADPYFGPAYYPDPYPPFEWRHITEHHLRYAPRAAAICGHDNILQMLFRKKDPSIVRRDTFKSYLMAAARSGRIKTIQTIGSYDPSLFESQEVKEFLMYEACARGHTTMVKAMLEAGMSVDLFDIAPYDPQSPHRNQRRLDPLKVAASFGHLETVKLLIEHGAPLQRSEERRWQTRITALGLAVRYGFLQISELLIKHGADVNAGKLNPLKYACSEGQAHMVKYLLEIGRLHDKGGIVVNHEPEELWSHARLAVMNGRPSVAEVLEEFKIPGSLE